MDSISLIKTPIEAELEDFKALFDTPLSDSNALLDSVITHIRKRNGKMMRPILVLLVARLYGVVTPATLHAAVSLELLHTASLVHDDVVDESTERRGQLSVNAIFNNKVSVLAGDYLLATSLVHAEQTNNYEIIRLVSSLGQKLAEGELLQLSNVSNHSFSEEVYFDVIRKKTAALLPLVPRRLPCQCRWVRRKSLLPVCWANILVSVFRLRMIFSITLIARRSANRLVMICWKVS